MSNQIIKHDSYANQGNPLGGNHPMGNHLGFPAQDPWSGGAEQHPSEGGGTNPLVMLHRSLRGRYPLALALGLAGAVVGAVLGWGSQGQTYRAQAVVNYNPTYVRDPINGGVNTTPFFSQTLTSEASTIMSTRIAENAMNDPIWQKEGDLKSIDTRSIQMFQSRVVAAPVTNSTHISITYDHWNPEVAKAGVNSVLNAYLRYFNDTNVGENKSESDTMGKSLDEIKGRIADFNDRIQRIHTQAGVPDIKAGHNASLARLSEVQKKLNEELGRLSFMEAERARIASGQRPKPTISELAKIDPAISGVAEQLNQARLELATARANLGERSPRVRALDARVVALQTSLDELIELATSQQISVVPDPFNKDAVLAINDSSIAQQRSLIEAHQRQLNDESLIVRRLSDLRTQVEDLEKQRTTQEQLAANYTNMVTRFEDGRNASRLLGMNNFLAANTAEVSNDRRQKVALFGAAMGFSAPIGLILLFGLFDRRFRYSDEAISTTTKGVNLLGILPNLPDRLSDPNQASIAAHCVHQIRTMLQLNAIGDDPAAISVTSAASGDGKTSLSLALGLSFAASGSRTLLIDADIIGAGLSARLGVSEPDGIGEAVLSRNILEFVRETDVADLSILPVGTANPLQASTFSPQLVRRLLNELKKHYDVLVIDTGPLMGSIEATPIVAAADTVILTVSRGQNRDLVEQAITHLKSIGARLAGVVFNRANARDFEKSISGISLRSVARTVPGQQAARAAAMNAGANPIISSMQADSAVTSHTHAHTTTNGAGAR